jgi:hypothetical protein
MIQGVFFSLITVSVTGHAGRFRISIACSGKRIKEHPVCKQVITCCSDLVCDNYRKIKEKSKREL